MSNFQKDVQLLTDLQELISDAERTANMPGYAGAVFNAISPALNRDCIFPDICCRHTRNGSESMDTLRFE